MNKIEQIKAEIERLKKEQLKNNNGVATGAGIYIDADRILSFIDSLPSEQPSEDLEKAAWEYASKECEIDGFKAGANWQKERDTRDMYMSDNRHFEKVYELGKKDMKEQMLKEAVEGTYNNSDWGVPCIDLPMHLDLERFDKVKIIIVKEEEK